MHLSHRLAPASLAVLALAATSCSSSQPSRPVNWTLTTAAPAHATAGSLIAAARKEGTLNVIGLAPGRVNYAAIITDFTRKYGIKVHAEFPDATSQQAISEVKSENGTARAPDVLDLDMAVAMANANLFAPYKVSTWNAIPPAQKDPSGLWVADYGGYMSIGYADKLGNITSLSQLLGPRLKNAVALATNPAASLGLGLNGVMLADPGLNAVMMASLANGGTVAAIGPGVTFFRKLKTADNLAPLTATDATIQAGTTKVVLNWDYLNQAAQVGVPGWKVFIPSDAVVGGYYAQAINKDAPHPAAARLWEEFLYSQAKNGGQNLWLQAGARPVELEAMTGDGTIDAAAAARLPKITRPPVFLTPAQATTAASYLAANWAREVS